MPLPPVSVDPVAASATAAAVQVPVPPLTVGAVGATVSTRHLDVADRVVAPLFARIVKVCAPSLSFV